MPTIPPEYLYDAERVPTVPDNVPPDERTAYLLEAYASRGDVIKRDQEQADLMRQWVDEVRKLYGEELSQPLADVEPDPDAP